MTSGTKVLLALIALFVGVLVLYYGFLMPEGDHAPEATRGPARDVALDATSSPPSPLTPAAVVASVGAAGRARSTPASAERSPTSERTTPTRTSEPQPAEPAAGGATGDAVASPPLTATSARRIAAPVPNAGAVVERSSAGSVSTPSRRNPTPPPPARRVDPTPAPSSYTVRSGDTLSSIALRLLGREHRWEAIARLNPGLDPARLRIGQELRIPADAEIATPLREVSGDRYVVSAGDTLSSIARAVYGNSAHWDRIYDANRTLIGADPHALEVGMQLAIPRR